VKKKLVSGATPFRVTWLRICDEVWWVEFDPFVGSEIRKTRLAVIISNDAADRMLARVVVVPLTSNTSRLYPGEALVTLSGTRSKTMADQIMAADKKRL
jgi:mRNA interferase MazF